MAGKIEATYPLRILVEIDRDTPLTRGALSEKVNDLLGADAHDEPWSVRRFFDRADLIPTTEGFYEIRGQIPVSATTSIRALGFELTSHLNEALVDDLAGIAMPDFPSSAFGPDIDHEAEAGDADAVALESLANVTWPLDVMKCEKAWNLSPQPGGTARGAGIVIGHPDTGYTFHTRVVSALALDRDFDVIDTDVDAEDPLKKRWWWPLDNPGHGTSTAGSIIGVQDGTTTGSAPDATVVPIRSIRSVVQVSDGDVADAIDRAVTAGAHVISMSLGGLGFYTGIRAAIARARASGVIVMAAAGNKVGIVVAPARFDECIAVAATGPDNSTWDGSSRGATVLVSAPGHLIPVAKAEKDSSISVQGTTTGVSSGTSYSVAHVAGIAALWLGHHGRDALIGKYGNVGLQEAFELVVQGAVTRPPGWDATNWGSGIVDALQVLEATLPVLAAPESASEMDRETAVATAPSLLAKQSALQRLIDTTGLNALGGDDARAALCAALGCSDDELEEFARIHGPELAFTYAEATALAPTATTIEAAAGEALDEVADPQSKFRRVLADTGGLSPMLRERLGAH